MCKWDLFLAYRVIQHPQINQYDISCYKMKEKNHRIISLDAEKKIDKIQHPFLIKTQQSGYIEGLCLNRLKAYMTSPQLTSCSMVKNRKLFSKIRNKMRMFDLAIFIQHSTESPSQSNEKRKRRERHQNQNRRSKTISFCSWCDIIYRKF